MEENEVFENDGDGITKLGVIKSEKDYHKIEYSIESRIIKEYIDEEGNIVDYEEGSTTICGVVSEDYRKTSKVYNELYLDKSGDNLLNILEESVQ